MSTENVESGNSVAAAAATVTFPLLTMATTSSCALGNRLIQIRDADVSTWNAQTCRKLSVEEVCRKFGIDIENDVKNKFFWNIRANKEVIVTEELLTLLGYSSPTYWAKKNSLTWLLKKNPHIRYTQLRDTENRNRKYYVLDSMDFESLLMQMRTPKSIELREIFSTIKWIVTKYCEYEKYYEERLTAIMMKQNSMIMNSMHEMKYLMAEDSVRSEMERHKADEERTRAEEERRKAEERNLHLSEQIVRNISCLRQDMLLSSSQMDNTNNNDSPPLLYLNTNNINTVDDDDDDAFLINNNTTTTTAAVTANDVIIINNINRKNTCITKTYRLGLFRTPMRGDWYIMFRRSDTWKSGERRLNVRGMERVFDWKNLPFDMLQHLRFTFHCNPLLTYYSRINLLKTDQTIPHPITEQDIIAIITAALSPPQPPLPEQQQQQTVDDNYTEDEYVTIDDNKIDELFYQQLL